MEKIWAEVQDTTQDFEVRRRGLLVYFHVSRLLVLLTTRADIKTGLYRSSKPFHSYASH